MRKIRNAAVVGIAAVSLFAGTVSAATADEAPAKEQNSSVSTLSSSDKDKDQAATTTTEGTPQDKAPGWETKAGDRPAPSENRTKCEQYKTNLDTTELGDRNCETNGLSEDIEHSDSSNSSAWGNRFNANRNVTGRNLLGLEKNFSEQPVWAQIWFVVTVLGVLGSVVGLVALPVLNQAKAQGFII